MRRHFTALVLMLGLVAIGVVAGRAQASSPAPRAPTSAKSAAASVPAAQAPSPQFASNTVFFSNLGPGGSFDPTGWCVTGATAGCGSRFDEAMPFYPSVSGIVTQIYAGVTNVAGPNAALVQLAQDNNGVPGAILAGGYVFGSPPFGSTCCAGSISISPSVPIGYGHRYWVIVRAATSMTFDAWNWSYYGGTTAFAYSVNGTTWNSSFGAISSFAVIGCSKLCKV
jgi:hypothetical protein